MKLKLDENIPQSAATRLAALGYDVDTVLDEQLGGRSDERLPDSEQWRVGDHLVGWFSDAEARTWERCMVIGTLRKVRVVRGTTSTR